MIRISLLLLLSFIASSAMARGYNSINLEYDFQRPGGDYTNFIAANVQECVKKCKNSDRCQAFDFYNSDNSCWLKTTAYPRRRYMGVISGTKHSSYTGRNSSVSTDMNLTYETDTQRPGGDYSRFQTNNGRECARQCAREPRCVAFDFTSSDYFCYLKSWKPAARHNPGIISGVKKPYYPQVKKVQELLIQKNYNPGPADGVIGKKTSIALEKYQRDHHIFVTGRIDDATLMSLGLSHPSGTLSVPLDSKDTTEDKMPVKSVKSVGVTYLQLTDNIYATILAKIPAGTKLQVLSENSEWYKVSYQNQVGYVLSESVEIMSQ